MHTLPVWAFSTGRIQVKTRFLHPRGRTALSSLLASVVDRRFTDFLPIWCWVIGHPAGLVVVDTGITGAEAGGNLFGRTQTRTLYQSGDRLATQMRSAGLDPARVAAVVFTHLHLDHDRGAGDFGSARLLASATELAQYTGRAAALLGYSRPTWTGVPEAVRFTGPALGPFAASHDLFGDGRIVLLPTPGHTAGHLSVLVRQPGPDLLLAGDLTYSQEALLQGEPGGVLMHPAAHRASLERVRRLARARPLVYLPSHDPASLERLHNGATLPG